VQLGQVSPPQFSMLTTVGELLTYAMLPIRCWKLFAVRSLTGRFRYDTFISGFQQLGGH